METTVLHPEEMADFFDKRATTYEAHMAEDPKFDHWNLLLEQQIPKRTDPTNILDLGCGTGLEIKYIFKRQPNARIRCIDLSNLMLDELRKTYQSSLNSLDIIQGSYFTHQYEPSHYDHIVACSTMHHWLYIDKIELYKRIYAALKKGATYILHDYYVTENIEKDKLKEYLKTLESRNLRQNTFYHIDIPFSVKTETNVLKEAGFAKIKLIEESYTDSFSSAMIVAEK